MNDILDNVFFYYFSNSIMFMMSISFVVYQPKILIQDKRMAFFFV